MVKPLKIVVTGASGFIAKNLRKYLSEKNIELISISRNNFKNFKYETKIIIKDYEENDHSGHEKTNPNKLPRRERTEY